MLKNLLLEIANSGLTQKEISEITHVPQPSISRVCSGEQKEVGYEAGKRIEALHATRCQTDKAA